MKKIILFVCALVIAALLGCPKKVETKVDTSGEPQLTVDAGETAEAPEEWKAEETEEKADGKKEIVTKEDVPIESKKEAVEEKVEEKKDEKKEDKEEKKSQ